MALCLRAEVDQQFFDLVMARLTPEDQTRLDQLYTLTTEATRTLFARLKQPPGPVSLSQIKLLEQQLQTMTTLVDTSLLLSRKNKLSRAFRELGRVVRTVFLLQYISDPALRRQITATTNKLEAFNGFCKWLFFGGWGIITDKDPLEQEKRTKYNQLVANAVILHNVVDMTIILRQLAQEGYEVTPETLAILSPYLTEHIQRFGAYWLDLDRIPDPIEFELGLEVLQLKEVEKPTPKDNEVLIKVHFRMGLFNKRATRGNLIKGRLMA